MVNGGDDTMLASRKTIAIIPSPLPLPQTVMIMMTVMSMATTMWVRWIVRWIWDVGTFHRCFRKNMIDNRR